MTLRKAETETLRSSVSEVRAKSAAVGADTDSLAKGTSSEPSYKVITQQIAYLMSAVANQTSLNLKKNGGCTGLKSNENCKYPSTMFQRPKRETENMTCWGCGGSGHSWRNCPTLRQGINLPFRPKPPSLNQGNRPNLNGQQGEETQASNPLPVTTREESTPTEN